MTTGQWILLAAVVLAVAFGARRARTDGRFRAPAAAAAASTARAGSDDGGAADDGAAERAEDDAVAGQERAPAVVSAVAGTRFADQLGERATLLQFSSAFCAPCRVTRRTLEEVSGLVEGVAHVEVDAELHLDLVRRLDVLRTPTTLVLDGRGQEVTRAAGAPTKEQVLTALAMVSPA